MVLTLEDIKELENAYSFKNIYRVIENIYKRVNSGEFKEEIDIEEVYKMNPSLRYLPEFFDKTNFKRYYYTTPEFDYELSNGNTCICLDIIFMFSKSETIKQYILDNSAKSPLGKWLDICKEKAENDDTLYDYSCQKAIKTWEDNYENYIKSVKDVKAYEEKKIQKEIERRDRFKNTVRSLPKTIISGLLSLIVLIIYNFFYILIKLTLHVLKSAILPTIGVFVLTVFFSAISRSYTFVQAWHLLSPIIPIGTFIMVFIKPLAFLYAISPTADPMPGFFGPSKEFLEEVSFKEGILSFLFKK